MPEDVHWASDLWFMLRYLILPIEVETFRSRFKNALDDQQGFDAACIHCGRYHEALQNLKLQADFTENKGDEMHIYQHRPESACRCMFVPVCLCSTASVPLPEHMTEVCKVWLSDAIIILKNDKLCKPLGLWFVVRNIFRRASKG
jgi:hypothetical protein